MMQVYAIVHCRIGSIFVYERSVSVEVGCVLGNSFDEFVPHCSTGIEERDIAGWRIFLTDLVFDQTLIKIFCILTSAGARVYGPHVTLILFASFRSLGSRISVLSALSV